VNTLQLWQQWFLTLMWQIPRFDRLRCLRILKRFRNPTQKLSRVISIILSGYVPAYPGLAIFTAVQILSMVLLIVGIERIAVGTFSPYHEKSSSRFSNIGLGALVIVFSILVVAFPLFSLLFLIFLPLLFTY
jgi:uncharacterized membrane protein HdeD (DUF308 family)